MSTLTRVASGFKRHLDVWRISLLEARADKRTSIKRGAEREFLPAVIELQETPPSPAARATIYVIAGFFAAAVLWSTFGKVDIIAVANGKIVPSDRSKVVQPLETGIVKRIHVRDGSRVRRGDPLIEIDTTAGTDHKRIANELVAAKTEIARLRALLADQDDFAPPAGADPTFVLIQRNRLQDQLAEFRALREQAYAFRRMLEKEYVSHMQYLEVEQKRAAKAQEYAAALAAAETRARSLMQELEKARTRARQQYLSAPIDGVVQQLAIHTVGGVVTPAQQLMVIAPDDDRLEIEAWIQNKDIGFVREDQEAEIKIESLPFTRYGTIPGRVVSISNDAVPLKDLGLFYAARVSLERTSVPVEGGRKVQLTPGMNVFVEIKTGKRSVIEYFLSPLIRAIHDSARER